jgi:hypothetical protein
MKLLLILLIVTVVVFAAFILLELESVKEEIVTAIKDKDAYGKLTASLHKSIGPGIAGQPGPTLEQLAQAQAKARTRTVASPDPEQR